jgi:hypothetical protein
VEAVGEALDRAEFVMTIADSTWFDELERCPRRIFVDGDPLFTQVDVMQGDNPTARAVAHYDTLFTYGTRLGLPDCPLPSAGRRWLPTRPVVATRFWPVAPLNGTSPVTGLLHWGAWRDYTFRGRVYGHKGREVERFAALPGRSNHELMLAVGGAAPRGSLSPGAGRAANIEHLASVMGRFGMADRSAYRLPMGSRWFGMPDRRRREVIRSADLLINVSGSLERPGKYRSIPRLAYIDTDPVFTQVRLRLAGEERFRRRAAIHDVHFSFGEHLSAAVVDTPYTWRPTRQPVVLSEWEQAPPPRDVHTTVMSWTSFEPFRYRDRVFAQKDVELRRFLDLPKRLRSARIELALTPPPKEHLDWETGEGTGSTPQRLLRAHGWRVVSAMSKCGDIDAYRRYLQSSKAEWSVAKNGYVVGQPGWFSCRSGRYLASGRPVVLQDTGFSSVLPVGEGILAFTNPDEAVAAIEDVDRDYRRHSRAARDIAEECFDARRVLTRLVEEGMSAPAQSHRPRALDQREL